MTTTPRSRNRQGFKRGDSSFGHNEAERSMAIGFFYQIDDWSIGSNGCVRETIQVVMCFTIRREGRIQHLGSPVSGLGCRQFTTLFHLLSSSSLRGWSHPSLALDNSYISVLTCIVTGDKNPQGL